MLIFSMTPLEGTGWPSPDGYHFTTCASAALRLGQPEGHVHGAVQVDGGRQFSAGLLPLVDLGIQRTKAQVAVGLERAHAELVD